MLRRRTNQRFVVTNLTGITTASMMAKREYDYYVHRGESEHCMDELKNVLTWINLRL